MNKRIATFFLETVFFVSIIIIILREGIWHKETTFLSIIIALLDISIITFIFIQIIKRSNKKDDK